MYTSEEVSKIMDEAQEREDKAVAGIEKEYYKLIEEMKKLNKSNDKIVRDMREGHLSTIDIHLTSMKLMQRTIDVYTNKIISLEAENKRMAAVILDKLESL